MEQDIQQPAVETTTIINTIPEKPLRHSYKKLLVGLVIICALFYGFSVLYVKNQKNDKIPEKPIAAADSGVAEVTPTSMLYRELTVPYLRERTYESTLGEREVLVDNGSYSSYLSSYDSDGFRVNGLLTIPNGDVPEGGWPAVVFIHGYIPPAQYQTTGQYADYVDYISRNGFVVFKIDLRGHGNSEGEAGGGYYGSDYIADTLNARAALQASDFVHPDKVGLWGHSMAGNVVMRSLAARPEIPAAVIWAGAVYTYEDMQKYGIQDTSYSPPANNTQRQNRRREMFEKVGTPSAQSPFWQQVAPVYFLNDLKGAIEIHHAVDDVVVNIGYSRDLVSFLQKTSVPHALHEYPSGGHNISGASFNSAMQRTVEFYQKNLQ